MHKTIYIFLIQFLLPLSLLSQNSTFEYLLSTSKNEIVTSILEDENGFIYACGYINAERNSNQSSGLILKIDQYGSFVDSIVVNVPGRRYMAFQILPDTNNVFVLNGSVSDTTRAFSFYINYSFELKKINSNLLIMSEQNHPLPQEYGLFGHNLSRGKNNILLMGGTWYFIEDDTSIFWMDMYAFIFELNQNFDSLKVRYFDDRERCGGPTKQLSDSTYWMCDILHDNYYTFDSLFNLEDHIMARPHRFDNPYGIKWDTDTSFYITGEWNGGNDHDIAIYRQVHPIDTANSIFRSWGTESLDIPANGGLDFLNKDTIYLTGTTPFWFNYGTWPSWYYVLQTDSNLNIRWERFYGGDAYYAAQSIKASKDGGCIIAGTRYDYLNASKEELDIHILKLNSEGLLVSTPEVTSIEMREALVFPNPGKDYLKVRVAAHHKQSTFELYDINGRIVLAESIHGKWGEINTSSLPSGTYIYRVYNEEGLFESGKWLKR